MLHRLLAPRNPAHPRPRRQARPLRAWLTALLTLCGAGTLAAQDLELHFIDVGQGHATLVVGPTGTTVLIDGGPPGAGNGAIVPYLQSIGVTSIDYGVATHYDSDHIGGMDEVFNAGYGPTFVCFDRGNSNIPSNGSVSGYLASISGQRASATVGLTVLLGNGAELEFVVENGNYPGGSINAWGGAQPENSSSVGMVVRLGDFEAWIGGDLTGGGNSTLDVESLVAPWVGPVEVVLVNHHGSRTSSNATFVSVLDPSFVVYGCGADNPYGHPDQLILNAWNSPGASRVAWSTTEGDTSSGSAGFVAAETSIVVTSDGSTFEAYRAGDTRRTRFATHELALNGVSVGELAISEVLVDPVGSSDLFGEWFELLGRGVGTRHLEGVRFESGVQVIDLVSKVLLAPGERLLVGLDGWESRNGQAPLDLALPFPFFGFANSSDGLLVRDAGGTPIEAVTWGAGGLPVTPGVSSERIDPSQPPTPGNFANAQSAWAGGDLGTPREPNDSEVDGCSGSADTYCIGAANSVGPGMDIGYQGSLDLAANDLVLTASGGPPGQFGIFYYGPNVLQQPFGDGFRCVGGTTFRLPLVQVGAGGSVQLAVDTAAPPSQGGQISDGSTWNFQFWYRDPLGPGGSGFNFSDALSATFCSGPIVVEEGDVVITEFLADPQAVPDGQGEWFEVLNTTSATLSLAGWTLEDGAGGSHEISSLSIAAGGRAVLGRQASPAQNGGVAVDYAYGGDIALGNGDGAIVVRAPGGAVVDQVVWQQFFFPVAPGQASSLDPAHEDAQENDNSTFWCLATTPFAGPGSDSGSPGLVNPSCP